MIEIFFSCDIESDGKIPGKILKEIRLDPKKPVQNQPFSERGYAPRVFGGKIK
jgi:hypothetical protein